MTARRPPAHYRRTRVRAQRVRATMEPLPDVPAPRYQVPDAAEAARKRRMH